MSWINPERVLVPVDFSKESLEAVRQARSLVQETSSLYIIHVLFPLHPGEPGVIWGTVDSHSRKKHAQEALQKELQASGLADVQTHFVEGDPGNEITRYAETINADLIVLPSHGRTGLPRLIVGSVAERVVRLAHCPVLVLKE